MKARINGLRAFALSTFAAAALVVSAAPAMADGDGAIEHRKAIYSAVGGNMKAMVAILKGKVPFKDDLKVHARAMHELSMIAGRAFPEGSDFGETDAKEEIWKKPAEFKAAMEAFQKAAAGLDAAAATGQFQATADAVNALGKTCKNCHDTFRAKH
ncbi:MAG: cytochrome c [Rhodospirillales bacterium]|nr:cytochrome c [Rhodospirillales bacterium]